MGINWARVVMGGVVAGIVVLVVDIASFGFVFNEAVNAAYAALGKNFEEGGAVQFALFIGASLLVGLVAVWLYAAIRARYGAGPRTALVAALAVWLLAYVFPNLGSILSFFPTSLVLTIIGVGLVESVAATLIGASLYRE